MKPPILHILAPGLVDRARQWLKDYAPFPRFVGIEAIMAKSLQRMLPAQGIDATLCWLFGLTATPDRDLPLGAVRRYGFTGDRHPGFWLCADPVHLRADIAKVYLRDGGSLDISQAEADELACMVRVHFSGRGWQIETASPAYWHLRSPLEARIMTRPQREAMGRGIEDYLPIGEEGRVWRALLNEAQMLLHGAEINRARESRGDAPINGLWLSGAGVLPAVGALQTSVTTVWSDDPVAVGLSRLAGKGIKPVPRSLAIMLADSERESHLVCLESMLAPARYDDFAAWSSALETLDRAWFRPIYKRIAQGKLAECHVYDCAGQRFSLGRARRWRVWRREKPLGAYVADP